MYMQDEFFVLQDTKRYRLTPKDTEGTSTKSASDNHRIYSIHPKQ